MGFINAIFLLTWSIVYCFLIFPIKVFFAFMSWFFTLLAYFPIVFILLAITALMFPWTTYHDKVVENVEFAFRCRISPVWTDVIRLFFQLFRLLWNPFICWWNALQWFAFGWIQDVIIPIALDGGIVDAIKKAADVLIKVVRDVAAGWILSGDFLTIGVDWTTRNLDTSKCFPVPEPFGCDSSLPVGIFPGCDTIPCDWDNTAPPVVPGTDGAVVPGTDTEEQCIAKSDFFDNDCAALCDYWISFFRSWSGVVSEFCEDLSILWKLQGVINPLLFVPYLSQLVPGMPLLNILSLFGSMQLQDVKFWCFLENAVNAGAAVLHVAWRMFAELVTSQPITRPDGTIFWDFTCKAFNCLVRSTENLAQIFVDEFLPWNIQFSARPDHPVCPPPAAAHLGDPACCIDTQDRDIANRCKIQRLGLLCALDTLFCILAMSINTIFNLFIQIDRVASFPTDDYYETVIKAEWVNMLNLWAPLTRFAPIIVFHPDDITEPFNFPTCPASACLDSMSVTPNAVPGQPFCLTYKFDKVATFPLCDVDEFIIDIPSCVSPGDITFQGSCAPSVVAFDHGALSGAQCSPFGASSTHYPNLLAPLRISANDPACCTGTECEVTVCMANSFIDSPGGIGIFNSAEPAASMMCNECKADFGFRCPPPFDPILVLTDNHVSVDDPASAIFGMHTIADCLCVFITRILCDPSNPTLPCFTETAGTLFSNAMFDFCCLTDIVLRTVADLLMGFLELTFSFTSPDKFFVFLDKMPYLRIFKENVVALVDCLFKAFQFIDTGMESSASVGFCLKNLFVQIARLALCLAEYAIRLLLGLIFLPYYVIELPGYDSFILEPNLARDAFVDIIDQFVGEERDSFVNCLCYLLNAGIPIPPLTTEGFCPTCTLNGFVEPGPNTKRDIRRADGTPVERKGGPAIPTLRDKWPGSLASKIGPLRMYKDEKFNPMTIWENIKKNSAKTGINIIPKELRDVDAYITKRREELFDKWEGERGCREAIFDTLEMKENNPSFYASLEKFGKLPDQLHCTKMPKMRQSEIRQERIQTRPPTLTISNCSALPDGCNINFAKVGHPDEGTGFICDEPGFENGPPCFDLCCLFRSAFRLIGHALKMVARFLSSLTQEWDMDNFNPTFPYFLGQDCQYDFTDIPLGQPGIPLDGCFENDLRILIQLLVDPVVCVCRIIELLIPIIPGVPQPDLCCFLSFTADLVGCIFQIFINAIKSLALDGEVASQCPQGTTPFPIGCNVNFGIDGNMMGFACTKASSDAKLPVGCDVDYDITGIGVPCTDSVPALCNPMVTDPSDPTFCTGCTPVYNPLIFPIVHPDPTTCAMVPCDLGTDRDGVAFSYFTNGKFLDEIDLALNITVSVVDCLCNLFNAVFPMKALSNGVFDPCCIAMSAARAAEQIIRFVLQTIVNIATIQTSGFCYWRLDPERCGIGGTNENPGAHLGEIGFVKQLDAVITTILTDRGGDCSLSSGTGIDNPGTGAGDAYASNALGCENSDLRDQGDGGILGCMCSIVSAIIPIRPDPTQPVGPGNCPILDFCCLFRSIAFTVKDAIMYAAMGLVSFWQPAKPGDPMSRPSYFIDFVFCNEATCPEGVPGEPLPHCNCGRLEVILQGILNFLIGCPCQFFTILEAFLDEFLPIGNPMSKKFDCFCGRDNGLLCAMRDLIEVLIGSILKLVRVGFSQQLAPGFVCVPGPGNNNPHCPTEADVFWSPPDGDPDFDSQTPAGATLFFLEQTWAGTFFGPIADSICRLAGTTLCFINRFFDLPCERSRTRLIQSLVRWVLEIAIRAIAFVEGVVKVFVGEVAGGMDDIDPQNNNQASFGGNQGGNQTVAGDSLGETVSNLLQVFADAAFADSRTLCGQVPMSFDTGLDPSTDCSCYSGGTWVYMPMSDNCVRTVPASPFVSAVPCPGPNTAMPSVFDPGMPVACVPHRCVVDGFRIKCDLPDCGTCRFTNTSETFCQDDPLDGILMTIFRYIKCMLGPALGQIMNPLIIITSILWQILGAIIRFAVSLVILLFRIGLLFTGGCSCHNAGGDTWEQRGGLCYKCIGPPTPPDPRCDTQYPAGPKAICSLFDIFNAVVDVFKAFVGIFESLTKIVVPSTTVSRMMGRNLGVHEDLPPFKTPKHMEPIENGTATDDQRLDQMPKRSKRIPRQQFRERARAHQGRLLYEPVSGVELMAEALFDYDVSDCFDDPVGCCCRNMHIEERCTWHPEEGVRHTKRDEPVTVEDVMKVANDHFGDDDATVCGHVIKSCSCMTWDSIPEAEKIEWVTCMELRFQGERLHDLMPSVPVDMFYNKDGTYEWVHNMVHEAKRNVFVQAIQTGRWNFNARKRASRDTDVHKWTRFVRNLHTNKHKLERKLVRANKIKSNVLIGATADIAIIEMKIRSGYYTWLLSKGYENWKTGNWHGGSILDAITDLGKETKNLASTVVYAPYHEVVHSTIKAWHGVKHTIHEVRTVGLPRWWEKTRASRRTADVRAAEIKREKTKKMVRDAYYSGPFYQWWNTTTTRTNGYKRLYKHVKNVIKHQRSAYKRSSLNLFNFDLKFTQLRGHLAKRFAPKWTPEKLENHEKINRVAMKIYSKFQPDHVRRDMEERFLINSNCRIIDDTWSLVTFLFDYCIDEFVANIPDITIRKGSFAESRLGKSDFLNSPNVLSSREIKAKMSKRVIMDRHKEGKWFRPRVVIKKSTRIRFGSIPKRAWRRILVSGQPFDLFDWFLCLLEDIFDSSLSSDVMDIFADIEAWLTNDNLDYVNTGGDVGLLYWILFWFRCDFPNNLNCSIGIGLERAIGVVGVWSLIIFVGLSLIFPSTMLPLIAFGAFLFYVIVIPAMAWHYSPRCWLMTPTMAFGVTTLIPEGLSTITDFLIRLGEGIDMPIIPWPVAFPALPECLWDDIIDFLDTYLTNCYDFLEDKGLGWIMPMCMINGDICPPCDQMIDILNCKDVGINDGIENLIYFINLQFPTAGQFVAEKIATVCFFNGCIADFFPFDFQYILDLFDRFSDVSPAQECRLNWCFWATLPTIAFFILIGLLIFTFLGFVIPLIFEFIGCLWAVFAASPMSILWLGNASNWASAPGDQTTVDAASVDRQIQSVQGISRGIGGYLEDKQTKRMKIQQMMMDDDNRWTSDISKGIAWLFFKPAMEKLKRE